MKILCGQSAASLHFMLLAHHHETQTCFASTVYGGDDVTATAKHVHSLKCKCVFIHYKDDF